MPKNPFSDMALILLPHKFGNQADWLAEAMVRNRTALHARDRSINSE